MSQTNINSQQFTDGNSQQSGAIQGPQSYNSTSVAGISVINLEDDIDDQQSQSPSKHSKNMSHVKEESSFLPDQIVPAAKVERKKIVKRVRFHDDENEIYPNNNYENNQNGTGPKRLKSNHQQDDEQEDDGSC